MVKTGHTEIRPIGYGSGVRPGVPVEVMDYRGLTERMGAAFLARPDRPSFSSFVLVHRETGQPPGRHTVDFQQVALEPCRLLRVQPFQVQSWDLESAVSATLIISPAAEDRSQRWGLADSLPYRDLGAASFKAASALVDALRHEQDRFDGSDAAVRLMVALFRSLDAIFDRASSGAASAPVPEAYAAFRQALEADLGSARTVGSYARQLGYSERTLSRACLQVTGMTAKGVVTARRVLEARRLLAHTTLPAAVIGARLGFSEATNFHKFFSRHTGQLPSAFRAANRP